MKALAMIALATVLATTATAQRPLFGNVKAHPPAHLVTAAARYVECLQSENDGVVASALAHAMWMKLGRPDMQFPNLRTEINALAVASPSESVRYRAHLASLVYDAPILFKGIESMDFERDVDLFAAVAGRVSYSLLENKEN
jgi:hypothetical protein